jgi:hypothetical protein
MQDTLKTILTLGDELEVLDSKIQQYEVTIKTLKKRKTEIQDNQLPDMMDELNLEECKLRSGKKIKAIDFVATKITDPNAAHNWLRDTNNSGIIKNTITINLSNGSDALAVRIKADLENKGVGYIESEKIHHSTLKSFVTEALNNSELSQTLPKQAFGIYEARRVVFK